MLKSTLPAKTLSIMQRIQTIRPKLSSMGNSINARNIFAESSARSWSAWGWINMIYCLSGGAFDRASTKPTPGFGIGGPPYTAWAINTAYALGSFVYTSSGNAYVCIQAGTSAAAGSGPTGTGNVITDNTVIWSYYDKSWFYHPVTGAANASAQLESMDAYGNYGAPGAQSTQMLARLPQIIAAHNASPDIMYMNSLFENDIGQAGWASLATMQQNFDKMVELIVNAWPNCLIIVASPSPSDSYLSAHGAAGTQRYNDIRNYLANYSHPNVVYSNCSDILTYGNNPLTIGNGSNYAAIKAANLSQVGSGVPHAFFYSDFWNTQGGGNVHVNEAGSVLRAKYFLEQFGYLFPNKLNIPKSNDGDVPGNVANIYNGVLTHNPSCLLIGGPGQTLSGVGQTYTYSQFPDTNIALTGQANATGLQINSSTTGATAAVAGFSLNNNVMPPPMTNLGDCYVQHHARVKIIDPTNLFRIGYGDFFATGTMGSVVPLYYVGTFTAGLSQVLSAGDTLTISSVPFYLPAGGTVGNETVTVEVLQQSGVAPGPKVEFQRICLVVTSPKIPYRVANTIASGSAVSLTTNTPVNIASINLPSGNWKISSFIGYNLTGATTTKLLASVSTTANTQGAENTTCSLPFVVTLLTDKVSQRLPDVVVNVPPNTVATYYLVGQATFSAGTVGAYGQIEAIPYSNDVSLTYGGDY